MPILALHGVSKSYGALKVTDTVSLAVEAGETLGILGPNGAGKTTLFNLIGGDVRADAGRVEFDGRDITALPPHRRCRLGLGRTYQIPQPFGQMTVFENLVAAASASARPGTPPARCWSTPVCARTPTSTPAASRC
jgi:branched-chain amino acid transport system ATP-binding protein